MKVEYDADTVTLAISLRKARIRESDEVRPGVIVDFGGDGAMVRFEILNASKAVDRTREAEEMVLERIAEIDLATAAASGAALQLEEHLDDPRWRALAEKHLR